MIKLRGINKSFGGRKVLEELSFNIEPNKITCILGPSGCGKTTTLQMLAGLNQPDHGQIDGLKYKQVSYAFQEPRLLPWKTVEDNIHFVLKEKISMPNRQKVVERNLELMGLLQYKDYYPHTLSGGMKQRLSLARAFAFPHQLLLMDEPFKSLDASLRLSLVKEVTNNWVVNNNTIVFITHDVSEALLLAHKLLVFSKKPTFVKKELTIDIPHQERNLSDERLIRMYGKLIT